MSRPTWLIGLLGLTLLVRWLDPLQRPEAPVMASVQPVERAMVTSPQLAGAEPAPAHGLQQGQAPWPVRPPGPEAAGDAFMTRMAALPKPVPTVVASPPPVASYVEPPPPPPDPPPPLQVIGTWSEAGQTSVFLAGPNGTVQASTGETVLTDYKVQDIKSRQVSLLHVPTRKTWTLTTP